MSPLFFFGISIFQKKCVKALYFCIIIHEKEIVVKKNIKKQVILYKFYTGEVKMSKFDIYKRNIPAISEDEQRQLNKSSVLIVGCGGLGGYIAEYLTRLGIGKLTLVDGDVFQETNLNRQLMSNTSNIGKSKTDECKIHLNLVNPNVEIRAIKAFFDENNADELLTDIDLVIDALDSPSARLVLEDACEKANLTIIHGAVQGWTMQVAIAEPGKKVLHSLYKSKSSKETAEAKTCLCPTPACCASIQVAEAIKLLIGIKSDLIGKLFFMDLKSCDSYSIDL